MATHEVLTQLIAWGESDEAGIPSMPVDPRPAWRLLMSVPWNHAARQLSDADLINLLRGLIFYSLASNWRGGSVSPVIHVYHEFLARNTENEPEVTSWIVDNRRNDYEPFGTIVHGGARTHAEFKAYRALCAERRAEGMARDAARQRRDAVAKADRATKRLSGAVKRGDVAAARSLLSAGADIQSALPPGESLVALARVNNREKMVEFLIERGMTDSDSDRAPGAM